MLLKKNKSIVFRNIKKFRETSQEVGTKKLVWVGITWMKIDYWLIGMSIKKPILLPTKIKSNLEEMGLKLVQGLWVNG